MITKAMRFVIRHPVGEDGSDNGGGAADEADDTEGADTGSKEKGADEAVEAEARAMGWRPKEQFKGKDEDWQSAADYVERGKQLLPMVQAKADRLGKRVQDLERTVQDFAKANAEAEKRGYERAIKQAQAERKAALTDGDGDAFEEADAKLAELRQKAADAERKTAQKPSADPVYAAWEERNPWMQDEEMSDYAEFIGQKMMKAGETARGEEFLNKITTKVKAQFPDRFKNPRRESAPSVEGGTPVPRKGSGRTYNDLPAEARAACDRMVKNGFPGDEKAAAEFKKQYLATYEWES